MIPASTICNSNDSWIDNLNHRISSILPFCFYATCLFLAALSFYFSISDGLFAWLFPDEIAASNFYHTYGLFGCAKFYYFNTTIYRVSGDIGVCIMAKSTALFSTPFMGWVFSRFVFYAFIPLSMAFLLREIVKIPYKLSLTVAFILSATALFIISDVNLTSTDATFVSNSYGLDLAM